MHATNGIVIQLKSEQMRQLEKPESTTLTRQKGNFCKPFYGTELMPYVKSKNKDNPQTLGDVTSNCNKLVGMLTAGQIPTKNAQLRPDLILAIPS